MPKPRHKPRKLSGLSNRYWKRTGPLRLKFLALAGLFASKGPCEAALPIQRGPDRNP